MTYRQLSVFLLTGIALISSFSCKKEHNSPESIFYGKWKTSYNDTITFARQNDKNVVYYIASSGLLGVQSPGPISEFEYTLNGELRIKENPAIVNEFRTIHSFAWVQRGNVFTVQSADWFPFMSAMYPFTFTRIQ